jgi:eukaryotic translation initiation factor 2C
MLGQSEYVRQFGMNIQTTAGPLPTQARILQPPTLQYGQGVRQLTVVCLSMNVYVSALIDRLIDVRLQEMDHGTCTSSAQILHLIHGFTVFNRIDKKFCRSIEIPRWVVVIYADSRRFNEGTAREMIDGLVAGCRSVGKHQQTRSSVYPHRYD